MNKTFKFSQKIFSRNVILITSLTALFCITLIFLFKSYKEFVYFLSMTGFLIAVLILFYRIRYNPYIIILSDENIDIEYLNKSFFRRKSFKSKIKELHYKKEKNVIILYNSQNQIITKINNDTIEEKDKEDFVSFLKLLD
jgi:hypothetical protein